MKELEKISNNIEAIIKKLKTIKAEMELVPTQDIYTVSALIYNLNRAADLINLADEIVERTKILEEKPEKTKESRDTSFDFNVERYLHGEKI
jgi:hypothetical protein